MAMIKRVEDVNERGETKTSLIAPIKTLYEYFHFCQYFFKKYHTIAISYKRIHFSEKRLA